MPTPTHSTVASLGAALLLTASTLTAQTGNPSPLPEATLVSRLESTVDSLARADQFSGVVLLMRQGAPVFQRAWGMADREAHIPNTIETDFNLGSINKVFTATAIRQLALAGRLDLDSLLGKYWPDYPNAAVASQVTIRELLNHRSGIGGNIFDAPPGGTRHDVRNNRDYLPLFVNEPLQFPPGSRQAYSNAGYVVLGLLVERLSGEDYYAYVNRHIYQPAGMTHTAAYPVDSLPPNAAIGYTRGEDDPPPTAPLLRNTDLLPGRGSAAGGGYSTAGDLALFLQALRKGEIPGGPPAGIGVAGGTVGVNSVVEGGLPGGYDLIVLTNLDPPAAERVARTVRGWLGSGDN
jgi:CubicO group peptidase (beta-lactamase class C family)